VHTGDRGPGFDGGLAPLPLRSLVSIFSSTQIVFCVSSLIFGLLVLEQAYSASGLFERSLILIPLLQITGQLPSSFVLRQLKKMSPASRIAYRMGKRVEVPVVMESVIIILLLLSTRRVGLIPRSIPVSAALILLATTLVITVWTLFDYRKLIQSVAPPRPIPHFDN